MKKVLILGVMAVVLVGVAYFVLFYVPVPEKGEQTLSQEEIVDLDATEILDEALVGTGSLESLRLMNKNLGCTFLYTPEEQVNVIDGTFFVSEGNIRGDFLTESPDLEGQVLSSMIIDGSMMYVWSEIEGESYGMKMDLTTTDEVLAKDKQPVSIDANVDYECFTWVGVDLSVFSPPGDVLFQDMSELMEAGMEEATIYEEGAEMPF